MLDDSVVFFFFFLKKTTLHIIYTDNLAVLLKHFGKQLFFLGEILCGKISIIRRELLKGFVFCVVFFLITS